MTKSKTVSAAVLKQSTIMIFILVIPLSVLLLVPPVIDFQNHISDYRKTHIKEVKQDIKNQIEQAITRLSFDYQKVDSRMRSMLREQVYIAYNIASELYENNKNKMESLELQALVRETLRAIRYNKGRGYFFATRLDGTEELFADKPELEGKNLLNMRDTNGKYVIRDMIEIAQSEAGEGFYAYTWSKPGAKGKNFPKLSYIKYFKPLNWLIGTGEYLDVVEAEIKNEAVEWIDHVKYGKDNYIFAFEYGGTYVAHVGKNVEQQTDNNYWNLKDVNGVLINQELERVARGGGGFVEYVWHKPSTKKAARKLAYAEAFKPWGWVIGTGTYLDSVENEIARQENILWEKTKLNIIFIVIALAIAFLVSFYRAMIFSKHLKKEFATFQHFFEKAIEKSEEIDVEKLTYDGFRNLAIVGNEMLANRIKAEEAIKKRELYLGSIVETTQDGFWLVGIDGKILEVNDAYCRMSGYSAEELKQLKISDIDANETPEEMKQRIDRIIENGSEIFETRHLTKDGNTFNVEISITWMKKEQQRFVCFCRDITARIQAQKEIEHIGNERSFLLENMINAFVIFESVFDDEGNFISYRFEYINKAYESITGVLLQDVVGKTVHEVWPETEDSWIKAYGQVATTGKPLVFSMFHEPTEKLYHCNVYRPWDTPERFCVVFEDITELNKAENERSKLQAQLLQSQKIESVGRLAGGIAHDFNNILTGITGHIQLAQMDLSPNDPIYEMLGEINAAADRASDLTRQLLAFSRKQIIEPKIINLDDLINNMHKMLGRIIGEDIEITIEQTKNLGQIKADAGQVEQIITNLAVNARDAMPKGGKLNIKTSNVSLDDEYCKLHPNLEQGEYVKLSISDTGEGMDEETQKNIFDPFFTTKAEGQGTGLGLATAYGIIKQHGGHVEVQSEQDKGTTFEIYFPMVQEKAEPLSRTSTFGYLPQGDETVLIVEDEPMVRNIAIKILKRLGYNIISAEDGLNALGIVRNSTVSIDLLLTDIVMPKMNGRELAEELQKDYPQMKVLFTSGYTKEVIASHGILEEGINFISKPYTPQALAKRVREVLKS